MRQALLISHDIGGFRTAFAYLSHTYKIVICYVKGPALLEAKRNAANTIESLLETDMPEFDIYVCTGWQTSFEKRCMKLLHTNETQWTGVLDNWNDYSERFIFMDKSYLPNQLIVFDEYASQLSKSIFPNIECKLLPNIFDLDFVRSYKNMDIVVQNLPKFDLFLADPISDHHGDKLGYNEFDQIHFILKKFNGRYTQSYPLCVRPHPSEDVEKYEDFINENNLQYVCVSDGTLLEDLHCSGYVFGDSSYAMHLAILVDKSVFCSIPLETVKSFLPHQSLKYLRELNV